MVMMSPVSATRKPAPAFTRTARTVTKKSSGAPSSDGSSEKQYCDFALPPGSAPTPISASWALS